MSRSLGDKLAQDVGVSCEPSVKSLTLDFERNHYVIFNASDGIWDAVSEVILKATALEVIKG
jgi:serine/threonine protein phosphatase PrpC